MRKYVFALLAAVFCMMLLTVPASAARQFENAVENCKLYDPDGMFDETEQETLNNLIRETSDKVDMYVAVYVMNGSGYDLSHDGCMRFADDKYDELFNPQSDVDTDGLLLLLNMDMSGGERYMYITTSGMGQLYYTNSVENDRISEMQDHLVGLLPRGNVDMKGAVSRFCSDAEQYYRKGIPRNYYVKDYSTGNYLYQKNGVLVKSKTLPFFYSINFAKGGLVGLLLGGFTALIAFLCIKSKYKFRKPLAASNYVSSRETTFYQRDDIFLRTHTSKTYIDRSSGSGGGGGGGGGGFSHSSSGGHSHGGGGRSF